MGMRAAINAFCKSCIYDPKWQGGGTWRKQVENCTSTDCPLYEYRPTSKGGPQVEKTPDLDASASVLSGGGDAPASLKRNPASGVRFPS